MANDLTVTIEGKTHSIEDFELGELEWLEEYLGTNLDDEKIVRSMKAATGFVYLIKRREDPEFTIDDARKMKLSVFDTPDEPANGNGAAKRRPTKPAARKAAASK